MLKVVELFAGIGSPRKALKNLEIEHKVIAFSEINEHAVESYRAIHDDLSTPNLGDITKVGELPGCDLLIFGSPCQDISIAGNHQGIQEGTRSGLLLEVLRLLEVAASKNQLPKYLLLENVANILSKEHKKEFEKYLVFLEKLGYKNFYKVLNAVDYGMPQNRERLFSLSILDKKANYNFPENEKLELRLSDFLESEVDEKYFISEEKTKAFMEKYKEKIIQLEKSGGTLKKIGSLTEKNSQGERVYTTNIAVTQNSLGGGLGAKTGLYLVGELPAGGQRSRVWSANGCMGCLTSTDYKDPPKIFHNYGIRKLTPLECFKLMGFEDKDFDNAKFSLNNKFYRGRDDSSSQLYKQAGNSIVVNVLEAIFRSLFLEEEVSEYKLF